jgi:hypothetical protein
MLASIDLNQNQLVKPRIENLGSDPSGVEGQIYYNTTSDVLRLYTGSGWVSLASAGGVTSFTNAFGTYISGTANSSATGAVSMGTIDLSASDGTASATTRFLTKDNTWATVPQGDVTGVSAGNGITVTNGSGPVPTVAVKYAGAADNLIQAANNQESQDILATDVIIYSESADSDIVNRGLVSDLPFTNNQGDITNVGVTAPITGGGSSGSVTIGHATQSDTETTASSTLSFGGTFAVYTDVTTNATGHVTGHEVTTFTMPANPNTNETYTLPVAAGGSNSAAIQLTAGGTGSGVKSTVTFNGTTNEIQVTESTGNNGSITIGLPDDVTIAGELTVSGTGQSSFGGQVTIPQTPVADTDAASKKYVDDLVSGGLIFKGTFRADTGEILSGTNNGSYLYQLTGTPPAPFNPSAARVAVETGDYYVVATAGGQFYGNGGTGGGGDQLDIGDAIIGLTDVNANSSDKDDWSTISQGVTVNSFTNANGTYVSASTVNNAATGAVTMGTIDLSAVNGTATTSTRFLSKDNTWDVPAYTTNTDAKYTLQANAKSGSNVPLFLDGTDGGSDSTVNLTEGTGITLTRNSSSQVTITADNNGTVTSVGCTVNGDAYSASVADSTGAAAITIAPQGTSSQYIDGAGDLQTFPTIPQGDITAVQASSTNSRLGISVSNSTGPIPVVGLNIKGQTNLGAAPATNDELIIYDATADTNKAITVANLASAVQGNNGYAVTLTSPTAGSETVTHSLGSYDVIVQLYGDTSKETIYACVDRTSTNALSITFDSAVGEDVRVLVTKVS